MTGTPLMEMDAQLTALPSKSNSFEIMGLKQAQVSVSYVFMAIILTMIKLNEAILFVEMG